MADKHNPTEYYYRLSYDFSTIGDSDVEEKDIEANLQRGWDGEIQKVNIDTDNNIVEFDIWVVKGRNVGDVSETVMNHFAKCIADTDVIIGIHPKIVDNAGTRTKDGEYVRLTGEGKFEYYSGKK